MKHELRRRCVRWLEKHWKQHEPEEHHLYLYDRNETVAVPELHTGKVKHSPEHEEQGEVIHYDNVAIPEIHLPHKNKQNKNAIVARRWHFSCCWKACGKQLTAGRISG